MRSLKRVLLFLVATFLLTGCYEDYIVINSKFTTGKIYQDSSQIIFFHYLQAGQPPKGISRFPDGGTQKIIFKNVSLYSYNTNNHILEKIFDFGNLPYGSWFDNLSLQNNNLIFGINPLMGWDWAIKHSTRSDEYKNLYDKYMGIYKYDLESKKTDHFVYDGYKLELSKDGNQIIYLKRDSIGVEIWHLIIDKNKNQLVKQVETNTAFIPIYWINNNKIAYETNNQLQLCDLETGGICLMDKELLIKQNDISITNIIELTTNISFKEWGFDVSKYWSFSNDKYINDIIKLNGNLNYRRAIIEEIAPNLNNDEIEKIIDSMNNYKNSLEEYRKTNYEFFSKETIELLKKYLN